MARSLSLATAPLLLAALLACGGSSGGPECALPADCPGADTDCRVRTCTAGVCGVQDLNGVACDLDGDACTVDVCSGGSCQPGVPMNCDDGVECTIDVCDALTGGCLHDPAPAGTACGAGLSCDGAGACVECLTAAECPGADTACRVRTCSSGTCGFQDQDGAACDDANACTTGDVCVSGSCQGGLPVNCDDGQECTVDSCDASTGACIYSPVADGTPCSDGSGCTVGDACLSGGCQPGLPANCDDGFSCTSDACDSTGPTTFSCSSSVVPGSCFIGGACWASGIPNPANPCQDCNPTSSATSWSNRPAGFACDADGNGCTAGDACSGTGVCTTGPAVNCDDGRYCTNDSCISTGPTSYSCSFQVTPGSCLIAGACWAGGAPNPANPCQACNPSVSATAWTNLPAGTVCGPGQACNGSGTCI